MMKMSDYRIRAHHGMCLAFFEGKGYDSEFTAHMGEMKKLLEKNPVVELVTKTDDICSFCPNNEEGSCTSIIKVEGYDNAVLSLCGLEAGVKLRYREFERLVWQKILSEGKRKEICTGCQWESICGKKEARTACGR